MHLYLICFRFCHNFCHLLFQCSAQKWRIWLSKWVLLANKCTSYSLQEFPSVATTLFCKRWNCIENESNNTLLSSLYTLSYIRMTSQFGTSYFRLIIDENICSGYAALQRIIICTNLGLIAKNHVANYENYMEVTRGKPSKHHKVNIDVNDGSDDSPSL